MAIDQNDIRAMYRMALYLDEGKVIAKDVQKAFTYLQISANKEYAPALHDTSSH